MHTCCTCSILVHFVKDLDYSQVHTHVFEHWTALKPEFSVAIDVEQQIIIISSLLPEF